MSDEIRKCWCGEDAIARICASDKPFWIIEHEHRQIEDIGVFYGITINSYADSKTEAVLNWNRMIDMGPILFMEFLKNSLRAK